MARPEIANNVSCESDNLKQYLSSEFALLMNNEQFLQALPGHLNYSLGAESRKKIVESQINAIIDVVK
ncbi:MAG: hypothetical protein Q8M40_02580 [Legionella sp.]|nr:hypothetical protein [Legionella sp.]